jgi:hypothetical protein
MPVPWRTVTPGGKAMATGTARSDAVAAGLVQLVRSVGTAMPALGVLVVAVFALPVSATAPAGAMRQRCTRREPARHPGPGVLDAASLVCRRAGALAGARVRRVPVSSAVAAMSWGLLPGLFW